MSDHAKVTEEDRKLAANYLAAIHPECKDAFEYDCDGVAASKLAQLLADAIRDARVQEAGLASQRAHCYMDVHSFPKCWFCQRIEQLKRGEA